MLDFLRKTKGGITPTLDEVDKLIESIGALDGNLRNLRVAISNNNPKAKKAIPALLLAIQGNLERDLRLVTKTRVRAENNYNQDFSEEDKVVIMNFCKTILRHLDTVFLRVINDKAAGNQLENKKYIISETKKSFIISDPEIMEIQNHLKKRKIIPETVNIIYEIKNIFITLIQLMLDISLNQGIQKTKKIKQQRLQQYFSMTKKDSNDNRLGDCPLDYFVMEFIDDLKKIIKNK